MKPLEDGSYAVGLFNLTLSPRQVGVKWADLNLTGSATVRDLWRQKNLGAFADGYSAQVNGHGVLLLRVASVPVRSTLQTAVK